MKLKEKHLLAAKKLAEGKTITEVSKICNCTRKSIYEWQRDEEFINAVQEQKERNKNQAKQYLNTKVDLYLSNLESIALDNTINPRYRIEALKYLVDQILGKAATKQIPTAEDKQQEKKEINLDKLKQDLIESMGNNTLIE